MKLPYRRSKSKKAKAADVLGSVAKLWSELQIAKRAGQGVKQGTKKASSAKDAVSSKTGTTPVKAIGVVALLGGAAAVIARKLKGGGSEQQAPYVPPPAPPAAASSDPKDSRPVAALVRDPVPEEPRVVVEETPVVLEDLAGQDADEPAGEEQPAGEDEPAGEEPDADEPAGEDGADEFTDDPR